MATIPNSTHQAHDNVANRPPVFRKIVAKSPSSIATRILQSPVDLLNEAEHTIRRSAHNTEQLHQALDDMIVMLHDVREEMTSSQWDHFVTECRRHPVTCLLHEDPFTRRAYEKPRGYAGDAELLDFIYGREEMWAQPSCSQIGSRIYQYTTRSPAPEGVRARRAFVAKVIDRLADEMSTPHVLSIAAGHLREAILAVSVKRQRLGRLLALDADPVSMQLVDREYGNYGVETKVANIRALFGRKLQLGQFDLVYSTGLFDYLNQASSRRLVTNMFKMLNPGGRLIVANFLPGIRDVGYMEIFMDWNLIYRTRQDMMDMTMELEQSEIDGIRVFAEENENIIFLEVVKR